MRICVDATALLLRSAGIKNYLYHWIRALSEHAPEHVVSAFPLLGNLGALDHDRSTLSPLQTYPRIALLQFINKVHRASINAAVGSVDIFHASNLVHAVPRAARLTGTIHDMTCMLMPHLHTPANVRAETQYCERVFKKADGLTAVSQSAKDDAVRLLGLQPERIRVIYHGIPEAYFDASSGDVPSRYGLAKPYVLFVGTIEPRKNIDVLLDAWEQIPLDVRLEHELVFVGPSGWAGSATVRRLHSGIAGIRVLGYVPENDLPSLTAGATTFAYPSLYEGFGFPIAQAMAAGVPVVTSNVSAMPEVVGDAGLTVDPRSTAELAAALRSVLISSSLQERLGSRGRELARKFTWKNSARQSAEFFTRVGS